MAATRRDRERSLRAAARARQGAAPERRHERRAVWRLRRERVAGFVWPPYTRRLPRGRAVACLVLNVAPFPGLGTALYGKWERGLAQFLLTFLFLIGWVWAVADGVRVVIAAFGEPVAPPGGG